MALRRLRLVALKRGRKDVRHLVVGKGLDGVVEDLLLSVRGLPGSPAKPTTTPSAGAWR